MRGHAILNINFTWLVSIYCNINKSSENTTKNARVYNSMTSTKLNDVNHAHWRQSRSLTSITLTDVNHWRQPRSLTSTTLTDVNHAHWRQMTSTTLNDVNHAQWRQPRSSICFLLKAAEQRKWHYQNQTINLNHWRHMYDFSGSNALICKVWFIFVFLLFLGMSDHQVFTSNKCIYNS